jgi:hypothetical protein
MDAVSKKNTTDFVCFQKIIIFALLIKLLFHQNTMTPYCPHIRFSASGRPSGERQHLPQFFNYQLITKELHLDSVGTTGTTAFNVARRIGRTESDIIRPEEQAGQYIRGQGGFVDDLFIDRDKMG